MNRGKDWVPPPDVELSYNLFFLPNFGVGNPSIKEAAELVAVDRWFSGEDEGVNEPEDFDGNGRAPWLLAALADTITAFEARLSSAVDGGRLKASPVRRDLDERLITEGTHVDYDDLVLWMEERGLTPGDHMADWLNTEITISELLCDEVVFLRAASRSDEGEIKRIEAQRTAAKYGMLDEAQDFVGLQAQLKAKVGEIHRIKDELAQCRAGQQAKVDRPLHTRQRRTLLTIIAALCHQANIDYTARGAAQTIKSATELSGVPIDDGTIIKVLREIPDALETRMK